MFRVEVPFYYRNKAVADGTASFYIDRCVGVQIATATYGIECVTSFDVKLKVGLTRNSLALIYIYSVTLQSGS
jgi:hypothetical protein